MGKILLISFLIFLSITLIAKDAPRLGGVQLGSRKIKLAILNFRAVNVEEELASAVSENLVTSISNYDKYQAIERSQLEAVFEELNLINSDDFDDSAIIEIGKLAKAKIVLVGSVSRPGAKIAINARGIEVETGKVIFGKKVLTSLIDQIPVASDLLAQIISRDGSKNVVDLDEQRETFLKHHKNMKIGGHILLGTFLGFFSFAVPFVVVPSWYYSNQSITMANYLSRDLYGTSLGHDFAIVAFGLGIGFLVTSILECAGFITLYVFSGINKRKYNKISGDIKPLIDIQYDKIMIGFSYRL
jgi:TolB-like protein